MSRILLLSPLLTLPLASAQTTALATARTIARTTMPAPATPAPVGTPSALPRAERFISGSVFISRSVCVRAGTRNMKFSVTPIR